VLDHLPRHGYGSELAAGEGRAIKKIPAAANYAMFCRQSRGARMAAEHVERKLAAILAADVVG
jgi:hypothetical protein